MRTRLFIGGEWVEAEGGAVFPSFAPATGETIGEVASASRADAVRAIEAAREAFDDGPWPKMSGAERAQILQRVAAILDGRQQEIATIEARDSGATLRRTVALDLPMASGTMQFFAGCAASIPDEEPHGGSEAPPAVSVIRREPYGVCVGIVPWNFPLVMAAWKIAPAIAAGNTVILKPASHTALSAIELVKACEEAGVPPGVVNLVTGPG